MVDIKAAPHLIPLMGPEDQRTFGPGIHPADDPHPPPKTDKAERKEQYQFANYLLLNEYPFCWHATNARSKATPGTPDFWVGVNRMSLWVEFKKDYTSKLSAAQEDFKAKLEAQGMRLYLVYSALEGIELVKYFDRVL